MVVPPATVTEESASLDAAKAAIASKNYDSAAQQLLALQQAAAKQAMTGAQQQAIADQQRALEQAVLKALSTGDPQAQAAAARLRAARTHH